MSNRHHQLKESHPAVAWLPVVVGLLLIACGGGPRAIPPAQTPSSTAAPSATVAPLPSPGALSPDEQSLAAAQRFDEKGAFRLVQALAAPEFMGRHVGTEGEIKGAQLLAAGAS